MTLKINSLKPVLTNYRGHDIVFLFIPLSLFSLTTWVFSHDLPHGFPCGELLHGNLHGKPRGGLVV